MELLPNRARFQSFSFPSCQTMTPDGVTHFQKRFFIPSSPLCTCGSSLMSSRNSHSSPSVLKAIRAQVTHIFPLPWKATYITRLEMARSTCKYWFLSLSLAAMIHAPLEGNTHRLIYTVKISVTALVISHGQIFGLWKIFLIEVFIYCWNCIIIFCKTKQLHANKEVILYRLPGPFKRAILAPLVLFSADDTNRAESRILFDATPKPTQKNVNCPLGYSAEKV